MKERRERKRIFFMIFSVRELRKEKGAKLSIESLRQTNLRNRSQSLHNTHTVQTTKIRTQPFLQFRERLDRGRGNVIIIMAKIH